MGNREFEKPHTNGLPGIPEHIPEAGPVTGNPEGILPIDATEYGGDGIPFEDPETDRSEAAALTLLQFPDITADAREDPVGRYMKEVSGAPLLSPEDELTLASMIREARSAREELVRSDGVLSPSEREHLKLVVLEGKNAQDRFLLANTRLVISVARKYIGHGLPFLDLIQEGNIGLIRASRKFDHTLGYKFSTYATYWIRQAIKRALADTSQTIRHPAHLYEQIGTMRRVQHELMQKLGRDPTETELAAALNISVRKLRFRQYAEQQYVDSLEQPVGGGEDEGSVLGDFIADESEEQDPVAALLVKFPVEMINRVLAGLSPREAKILRMRYGMDNGEPQTLNEVGRKFGLTRERIRQIEKLALAKLRKSLKGLENDYFPK